MAATLPKQDDATSCGVFVAMYAYYWLHYRKFPDNRDFTQDDVPALRLFIASRLLSTQKDGLGLYLERLGLRSDMSNLPVSFLDLFLHVSITLCNAREWVISPLSCMHLLALLHRSANGLLTLLAPLLRHQSLNLQKT